MNKNISCLICPNCGAHLNANDSSLVCEHGHCFDISKEGYVNLLLPNMKKTKEPGDDKVMISARQKFLNKGYFSKLKNEIEKTILDFQAETVLDAGCGTGYYANTLWRMGVNVIGIDISKFAIQCASKNNCNVNYFVASIFNLPILENSIDVILNVFAPKPQNEFKRILKENGIILEVVPGEDHLKELKQTIYQEEFKHNKEKFVFDKFKLKQSQRIIYQETITEHEDIVNLAKMTPYWYKGGQKNIINLESAKLTITFDFIINVWEKIK